MKHKDTGGQAFPVPVTEQNFSETGMTLRDYFAGQALVALWSDPDVQMTHDAAAKWSYEQADAMLEARK